MFLRLHRTPARLHPQHSPTMPVRDISFNVRLPQPHHTAARRYSSEQFCAGDLFKILGVSKESSAGAKKNAYHQLAIRFHPDNRDSGNATKFRKINEEYQCLLEGYSSSSTENETPSELTEDTSSFYRATPSQASEKPDEQSHANKKNDLRYIKLFLLLVLVTLLVLEGREKYLEYQDDALDRELQRVRARQRQENEKQIEDKKNKIETDIMIILRKAKLYSKKNQEIIKNRFTDAIFINGFEGLTKYEAFRSSIELLFICDLLTQENLDRLLKSESKTQFLELLNKKRIVITQHHIKALDRNFHQNIYNTIIEISNITSNEFKYEYLAKDNLLNSLPIDFKKQINITSDVLDAIIELSSDFWMESSKFREHMEAIIILKNGGMLNTENLGFVKDHPRHSPKAASYLCYAYNNRLFNPKQREVLNAAINHAVKIPSTKLDKENPKTWDAIIDCIQTNAEQPNSSNQIAESCVNQRRHP